jgi:pimeloyl-ACP methyl ester carboxylesterase
MAVGLFTSTRGQGTRPDDLLPLGARRLDVRAAPNVRGGYVWGEEGPAALLAHGWGIDSSSMRGLVAPLRALGYQVAAFDAPGHGVCPEKHATLIEFTAATESVLDALGDVRVVVAHSLGAISAVAAVAGRPGLAIEAMILLAPPRTLAGVVNRWSQSELRLSKQVMERMGHELSLRNGRPLSYWDIVELGGKLHYPVLAIHDPGDDMVPYSEAEAIAAGLPNARLEPAAGYGHLGILMAAAVQRRVAAFVAEHASFVPDASR